MPPKINPVPEGYHSVIPYLCVKGADQALEFYKRAFGAVEIMRMPAPNAKVGHAEIKIGDSHIMIADEFPDLGFRSPKALGGSPVGILLYVENADKTVAQAVAAGAKVVREVKNQFYGDRSGTIEDPFGHSWYVSTHIEDVPFEELKKRAAEDCK